MGDQQKKHICPHIGCTSAFNRPYRLAQHLLVHNNIKAFACPEENCLKAYTNKSHLDRHINTVHKVIPITTEVVYTCPKCLRKYANRQNLKRHIKIYHKIDRKAKYPFVCDSCESKYKKKHQLAAHMNSHTGVKAFNCEHCSKAFVTITEKKKHTRTHKTYQCVECDQTFIHWSKYCKHLKSEHEVKEYICNDCNRVFKKRNHLVRHVKVHDRTKVFFCPYVNCERFYSRNSNLKQHILMRHEQVTYDCAVCNSKLSTKKSLEDHIKKRHMSEPKRRTYKTKADGRKIRRDVGSLKVSTATMLTGLPVATTSKVLRPSEIVTDREVHKIKIENIGKLPLVLRVGRKTEVTTDASVPTDEVLSPPRDEVSGNEDIAPTTGSSSSTSTSSSMSSLVLYNSDSGDHGGGVMSTSEVEAEES